MSDKDAKPLNRFSTGHYVDLAAHLADVVAALQNELLIAMNLLEQSRAGCDTLRQQIVDTIDKPDSGGS